MFNCESSSKSVPSWSGDENVKSYQGEDNAKKMYKPSQSVPSWSSEENAKPYQGPDNAEKMFSPSRPSVLMFSPSRPSVLSPHGEGTPCVVESSSEGIGSSFCSTEGRSSPEIFVMEHRQDGDSSKLSSATNSLPYGTRDLWEAVAEIRDEFQTAAGYGEEVAEMLFLNDVLPSLSSRDLSTTLDKLYAWEKKLYKEVKEVEKFWMMYNNLCKRYTKLDQKGADPSKIEATDVSMKRLWSKLDVSYKSIDVISTRINKLRDEELKPQVTELIHGLIRMWKAMLKCHQNQFKAVMESKMRRLTTKCGDHTSRATRKLERELRTWCDRFNDWIASQKSFVESLNGWLVHCIQYEPEMTPDGPVPYSPGQLEAPPVFVVCNDWHQNLNAVSEVQVADAMVTFAVILRKLWKTQNKEGRQRKKTEYYEKRLWLQQQEGNTKTGLSVVASDQRDDLKVDFDSVMQKVYYEREKHMDVMELVHRAASSSLQGGLIPIFKALEDFTSEALKAHEEVRLQEPGLG